MEIVPIYLYSGFYPKYSYNDNHYMYYYINSNRFSYNYLGSVGYNRPGFGQ
jgi:hypothetical protein